jgi:hypothetical protein
MCIRAGAERHEFVARAEPVSREANDVAVAASVVLAFIGVRIFRFHRLFCRSSVAERDNDVRWRR